jgi:hypothetical protein
MPDPITFTSAAFNQLRLSHLDSNIFAVPKYSLVSRKVLNSTFIYAILVALTIPLTLQLWQPPVSHLAPNGCMHIPSSTSVRHDHRYGPLMRTSVISFTPSQCWASHQLCLMLPECNFQRHERLSEMLQCLTSQARTSRWSPLERVVLYLASTEMVCTCILT